MGHFSALERGLLLLAALVIVVAGMRAATPILAPFLLSVFIAVISAPYMFYLQNRGLSKIAALTVAIAIVVMLFMLIAVLIGNSIEGFRQSIPSYQAGLQEKLSGVVLLLAKVGIQVALSDVHSYFNPAVVMRLTANTLSGLGSVLTNGFLIIFSVIFILIEAASFCAKFHQALERPDRSLADFDHCLATIQRYMAIKTWISLLTGIIVWLSLKLLGIDYPSLWGVLAFFLNYVPNIGSIIAAVPAVLLALVQFGWGSVLAVVMLYLAINIVIGNLLEPRLMGKGLGVSTLVVFLSLVFWGWVLGPIGMLLSVPLTVAVKIALAHHEDTAWIALLLDSSDQGR